jgi:hypothetical protein
MNYDTIVSCIEKIQKHIIKNDTMNLPYFINTENKDVYIAIREELDPVFNIIEVSSYCRTEDDLPDMDMLFYELRNTKENILLVGFSQYLKLRGEEQLNHYISSIKSMTTKGGKIVIISYQIERELQLQIKNDLRLIDRFIFLSGVISPKPYYVFVKSLISTKSVEDTCKGFKDFLKQQEILCTESSFISTNIDTNIFNQSTCSVKLITGIFDTLFLIDQNLASLLFAEEGSDHQWEYLIKQLESQNGFRKVLEAELGVTEKFELIFHKWRTFNSDQRWLYWLVLKTLCNNVSYLVLVANSVICVEQFVEKLYIYIFDIDCINSSFMQMYCERKNLLYYISSPKEVNNFCSLAESKGEKQIYYLTNLTEVEKKKIIKCLCEYTYTTKQIDEILEAIYPELSKYLLPFNFNKPLLDDYFQDYKYQKLTNKIYPEFLELVNQHAWQREFNYELPTRMEIFEKIDKNNAVIYFFDALGVEFLGYIIKKCNELGMDAKISICRANLPSITACNKDFLEGIDNPISIKNLDELKHAGEGDYDYRKTPYPIHITKELKIIDDVLENAMTKLSKASKVIIVSDHGASRLVVINKQQYNFDVNSKGTHGGRCCEYTEFIHEVDYATEESGYYVLASYDRFKGGRAASVETHGGATLEEVIVPIIELSIKNEQINVCFIDTEIVTSYKKKAELVLFSNCKLNSVSLKINGKYYQYSRNDELKYYITIADIKRAGKYVAEVFEENNFVAKLDFTLKKEISGEKDLF